MADLTKHSDGTQPATTKSLPEAPSKRYVWYSMCSAHQQTDDQCDACHFGSWIDELQPDVIADNQLYKDDPVAWIKKHNPGISTDEAAELYKHTKVTDLASNNPEASAELSNPPKESL